MGKAQSKRSVDITTETKKGADDEITEKMEKIEDLDKKEVVNGDATVQEKQDIEKKDGDEIENDKDMTTEKNLDSQSSGELKEALNSVETPKEEGGIAIAEEISPLADESLKKSKKEKVKKKWSFRNISFGKKDKQKPSKSEETVEDEITALNGPEIDVKSLKDMEDFQKEEEASKEAKENSTEHRENGDATQQELNGTEQSEKKACEEITNDVTANFTNNTTKRSGPIQSETTVESSDVSEKTEVTAVTTTINIETNISENNSTVRVSKSDNGKSEISNATEQELEKEDVTNASNEISTEKTTTLADATNELSVSTNGEVLEKTHPNGNNIDQEIVDQSKAQIEVNFNTDNKVFAATLDSFPSTSINPYKAQIYNQELNATTKIVDILKVNDTEEGSTNSFKKEIKKNVLLPTEIEMNKSAKVENINGESSPPPLPISPPPSQVSVFAFKNNEESVKDSFSTKNSQTVCPLIEENFKMSPSHVEVLPDSTNLNDIREDNEQFLDKVHNDNIEKELQENIYTRSVLDQFEKKEFFIAAEVINEIADKAAEIVSLQLDTGLEKGNTEDINEKTVLEVENNVEHKEIAEEKNASECRKKELAKYFIEPTVIVNQTNDIINESSLTLSTNEAIQQVQNEMFSLSVEEHLTPTKEFGNAKDLKENTAAAEVTQDLSVTCE